MKRVALLGAYSIDNAGDQLLGYAVRQTLRTRLPSAEIALFAPAFRGDMWRHDWSKERGEGVPVTRIPADDGTAWARDVDAVVIGGGGIIRVEPDFRPFLLGEAEDWGSRPAGWNAVGAEDTPAYVVSQRAAYRAVARCCEALAYVSVRNETTLRFVRRCGYQGEVAVVPDPALLLELPPGHAGRGEAILREAGVDAKRKVVGVSVGRSLADARAAGFYKELFASLASLPSDREVLLFPFGNVYGDVDLQRAAHKALPRAKLLRAGLSALDRWALIGALDLHVCTRYHAMLAAFAQDVPFVVLDEYLSDAGAVSKIRDFVVGADLEAFYLSPFLSTRVDAKLANARALIEAPGFSFKPRLGLLRKQLDAHYDAMLRALSLP